MLKYIKGHMDSIQDIEIFPIISLLIFFTFFAALFIWVVTAKKKYIDEVSNLPLENDEDENNQNQ